MDGGRWGFPVAGTANLPPSLPRVRHAPAAPEVRGGVKCGWGPHVDVLWRHPVGGCRPRHDSLQHSTENSHAFKRLQYIVCSAVAQTCKLAAVGTRLQSGCCGIDRGLVTWMICSRCPPTSLPPGPPKPASDNINPSRNPRHIKASSILWRSKWRRRARSPTHLVVPAFLP